MYDIQLAQCNKVYLIHRECLFISPRKPKEIGRLGEQIGNSDVEGKMGLHGTDIPVESLLGS